MMLYLSIGIILGTCLGISLRKFLIKWKNYKEIKNLNDNYNLIIKKIKNKNSRFLARINNTVYLSITMPNYGRVDLLYLLDEKEVLLYSEGKCILDSTKAKRSIIDDVINNIEDRHSQKINDVINIFGYVISKYNFEKMFKINTNNIDNFNIFLKPNNEVDKTESITTTFDIDDILDKINKVGIDNLTKEEKDFLTNYNKK